MVSRPELVTGATGFIGGHLARRLLEVGRPIRVLCRKGSERKLPSRVGKEAEVVYGDLKDQASLRAAADGSCRVYHCAGHVSDWGRPEEFEAMNVRGTELLAQAALEGGAERFIHFSSIAAFGTPAPDYFDDDSPLAESRDSYSRTKAEGEKVVLSFSDRLPVTILRPAVVYGPGGTWLEEPLKMIELGKMFLLGGGKGTCHPTYIENLLDAALLVSDHPKALGRGYIVTDGDSVPFHEYFNSIAKIAGRPPIARSIPLPVARAMAAGFEGFARLAHSSSRPLLTRAALGMVTTESRVSIKRIRDELGFEPRYTFHAAMDELAGWYRRRGT